MRKSIINLVAIAFIGFTCMSCKEKEEEISSLNCVEETVMLQGGETLSLSVEALPKGAKNLDYYWEIANTDIVSVNDDVVTAKSFGETWIYAVSVAKPQIKDSVRVIVGTDNSTSISCSADTIKLYANESYEAFAKVENAYDISYDWIIADNSVIGIENNIVSVKKYGSTWLYAVSKINPSIKDSIKVEVFTDNTTKIACSTKVVRLQVNESSTVSATVANALDDSFEWEMADNSVASIENNTVTAKKLGTTWLYANSNVSSSLKDSIKIIVMPSQKSIAFTDVNIAYEGRFNFTSSEAQYFYPGSTISTTFTGTSIYARFNKVEAYYWIEIDNMEPFKIGTKSNKYLVKEDIYALAEGLTEGTHTVRITLCSEGIYKNPKFYGLVIDENASLAKPAAKPVKFEFIGNSITCGYGTEVTDRSPFKDSTSNFCHGFAYLTTKEFNAELMVVARSGIGIYRNYGNKEKADGYGSMPDNYEKLWLQNSSNWDFTKYTPDVLFINLGTNDTWEMSSFNAETYETCYRGLMDKIYSHYPNVKIVLLTGSMMDATALKAVKPILNKIQEDYSTEDHPVYRFDFAQTAGTGADWHPCAAQQAKMGSDLIKFLKNNNIVK